MDFKQLIRNWHSKAKAKDEDYFSKFVFEYLAFIAYLKKIEFCEARNDRDAIQRLKRDAVKDKYLKKIEDDKELRDTWDKIVEKLKHDPLNNVSGGNNKWWNCSYDSLEQKTGEEKRRRKGTVFSNTDWENMVEYWYSIRNNFFHGGKDPEDRRDSFLVENGFKTLSPLVDIFLEQYL